MATQTKSVTTAISGVAVVVTVCMLGQVAADCMLGADNVHPTQSLTTGGGLQQPANCSRNVTAGPATPIPTELGTSVLQMGGTTSTSSMLFASAIPSPQVSSIPQVEGTTSPSSTPSASTIPSPQISSIPQVEGTTSPSSTTFASTIPLPQVLSTTETFFVPISPTFMPTTLLTSDTVSSSSVDTVTTATLENLRTSTQNFLFITAVVETTRVSPSESVESGIVTDPSPSELNHAIIWGIVAASVLIAAAAGGSVLILLIVMHRRWRHKRSYSDGTLEIPNGRMSPLALDNVVYSGAVSDTISLSPVKVSVSLDGVPPVHKSRDYETLEPKSNNHEAQIAFVPQLHYTLNGDPSMPPQEYEIPVCTSMSSTRPSDLLKSIGVQSKRGRSGYESQYVVMGSDTELLHKYSLRKQAELAGRQSKTQSATTSTSEQCSSVGLSEDYYRLLEEETEGSEGQYHDPPSSEKEILETLTKQEIEEIPQEDIRRTAHLGAGQFGDVEKAIWKNKRGVQEVAIKSLPISSLETDKLKLLQEAAIMAQFRHPNVVRLLGVVTSGEPTMLVLEYLPKEDLRKCLVKMGRSIIPPDAPHLLLSYSQQVALGMHYLSSKGFIHRDLAARNIFVTQDDVCKVGDLGMSRDLADAEYYLSHGGKIPVRWTSPEAMYYRRYSSASDVWSYGCLLYEIWSLGRMPFKNYTNAEVIEKVDSGYRLPPPPGCPRMVYEIMINSWHPRPSSRPNFKDILLCLLEDEERVLKIPISDASTNVQAIVLGSALKAGEYMYADLQHRYHVRNSLCSLASTNSSDIKSGDYDHISVRKYLLSFPTSTADLEFRDSSSPNGRPPTSYRHTLLTSDIESDYEDIED